MTTTDPDTWLPIRTLLGTKWVPTFKLAHGISCHNCPVRLECAADVARGDYAWCEDIIPADYTLTNPTSVPDYHNYHVPNPKPIP